MTINISTIIIVLAASFEAYNFGLFGDLLLDNPGHVSFWGSIIGIVVSFGTAIVSSKRGSINSKGKVKRERQMELGMYGLWLVSVVIIAPTVYFLLGDKFGSFMRFVVSIVYSAIPALTMFALGATNGAKGVMSLETQIKIPPFWLNWRKKQPELVGQKVAPTKKATKKTTKPTKTTAKKSAPTKPTKPRNRIDVEKLRELVKKNPTISNKDAGDVFGVSAEAIRRSKKRLGI